MSDQNEINHFTGCLLGGAVGDALGCPVEFDSLEEITEEYGSEGVFDMIPGEEGLFEITDDTQMTLFTAEGLLRAWTAAQYCGEAPDYVKGLRCSYHSWLKTQGEVKDLPLQDGWLYGIDALHSQREPGNTCLTALREGTFSKRGIVENFSKGCGGVMRAAPAGLLATRISNSDRTSAVKLAFEIGCAAAALTHGHPSGYYPAGALATIIATIITGGTIEEGINISLGLLDGYSESAETIYAIRHALELWRNKSILPAPEIIETFGGGWVGEEALAISLYCALVAKSDFAKGVRLAVNHSGDSDSTGSVTGNILGALLGEQVIPREWLNGLELVDVIRQVGKDLYTTYNSADYWLKKYPPVTCSEFK